VRDRVFLPGFIPDVKTKLSAFDLFVHTSQSEALGYAILEAGCASLPVISTNVGGIPEIIMDEVNGFLIPPFRPDLVADKIRNVIQNPELSLKLSSALKARVESTFSLSQMAHKTFSLYR
jgi:glycosyltransferase involved in cell wall biosynthesis